MAAKNVFFLSCLCGKFFGGRSNRLGPPNACFDCPPVCPSESAKQEAGGGRGSRAQVCSNGRFTRQVCHDGDAISTEAETETFGFTRNLGVEAERKVLCIVVRL